jgi:DnaJ-class molecular chaperone
MLTNLTDRFKMRACQSWGDSKEREMGYAGPIALENAIRRLVESGKRIQAYREAANAVEARREERPCERCEGTGFIEVEIDHFGRKTEWIPCPDCRKSGVVGGEDDE